MLFYGIVSWLFSPMAKSQSEATDQRPWVAYFWVRTRNRLVTKSH